MGMKLLTPFANKDKQQEEITRKILRIQEIEDLATKANARLARAEADFADSIARNRAKWALEEQEHADRINAMSREVEALEERKNQALIPIQMYREEVDKVMAEAQEMLKKAKEREEQAEYLQEKLEEKLTEVEDRLAIVKTQEDRLTIAKQGIESQKEATKEGIARLSEEMLRFHEKQQSDEANMNERKKEIALAEINLNAKLEKYARDLEAMKIWEKQLEDQRATLERAIKRIK